jgi:hypothetical protein
MDGLGTAIGLILSAALTRSFASLLYGVTPLDPMTCAAASATLAAPAFVACVASAVLALRTDPAATLRQD